MFLTARRIGIVCFTVIALAFGVPASIAANGGSDPYGAKNCTVITTPSTSAQCDGGNAYATSNNGAPAYAIGVAGNAIDATNASTSAPAGLYGGYFAARIHVDRAPNGSPANDAAGLVAGISCDTTDNPTPSAATCGKGTDALYVTCDAAYATLTTGAKPCSADLIGVQGNPDDAQRFAVTTQNGINFAGGSAGNNSTYSNSEILVEPGMVIKVRLADGVTELPVLQVGTDGTVAIGAGGQVQLGPQGQISFYSKPVCYSGPTVVSCV